MSETNSPIGCPNEFVSCGILNHQSDIFTELWFAQRNVCVSRSRFMSGLSKPERIWKRRVKIIAHPDLALMQPKYKGLPRSGRRLGRLDLDLDGLAVGKRQMVQRQHPIGTDLRLSVVR